MTEYGRGPGSQPWHPDDPLYGDQGWDGGRPAGYQEEPGAQGGEWQQQPYQDPYGRPVQGGQADPYGQYPGYEQDYGRPQAGPAGTHPSQYQQPQQYQQPYGQQPPGQGYGQQPQQEYYADGWQGAPQQPQHPQQPEPGGDPYAQGYGAGQAAGVADPYAPGGYGPGGVPSGQQPPGPQDYYGAPGGYGGPGAGPSPGAPGPGAPGGGPGLPGTDPDTGWDPGPDQGEHAFFTGTDADRRPGGADEDEDEEEWDGHGDDPDGGRRGGRKGRGGTKRRSGCACLAVCVVLAGGVGGVGYLGYRFYESHFAPAPDYAGGGSGQVQVTIPQDASIADMGNVLKGAGVVKSVGAFVEAANDNKQAVRIQPGVYSLRRQMSGASAIELMLSPASQNALIIPEGVRATKVYQLIDSKLGAKAGTTREAAESGDLGLPSWAHGKAEGFLYPSRYTVGKGTEPEDLLREMVKRAESEQRRADLDDAAKKLGKTPEQILTIASLIQAEAQEDEDFGKVSRVIYNRLDQDMALGFDSTINYAKGRSSLDTSVQDTRVDSPYNTYLHKGLPPGPIDNPGEQAVEAALKPTKGDWLYFVTVKPGDTRFTASKAEHDRNVAEFNEEQRRKKENGG